MSDRYLATHASTARSSKGHPEPASDDGAEDIKEPSTIGSEIGKANVHLSRSLEIVDACLTRIRGPQVEKGVAGNPVNHGLLSDAELNRDLSRDLANKLDELASLIG